MNTEHRGFSVRLRESLAVQGIHAHGEQVRSVAIAAAVSPRTARRYLNGESSPRYIDDHVFNLATSLGVLPGWLIFGGGPRTHDESEELVQIMLIISGQAETAGTQEGSMHKQKTGKYYQDKLRRASLLRMNDSRREYRLMEFVKSGQISLWDYLDMV